MSGGPPPGPPLGGLAASTTDWPVPAQAFSAAWIRAVSGGADSSAARNSSSVGAGSVAVSVWQVAGSVGWVMYRVSPVRDDCSWARLATVPPLAGATGSQPSPPAR